MTYNTTLTRKIEGTQLEIEFNIDVTYEAYGTSGDGWNEPREDAYVEIECVTAFLKIYSKSGELIQNLLDGIELTDKEREHLEETITDSLSEEWED